MKYTLHDGELVSLPWKTALVEMEKTHPNNVNEGHRTLARQRYFYNCMLCKCCNNGNLAAFPSPFAPHIRTGRIDHAVDFSDGAAAEAWLDEHGISAWRTAGAGTSQWEPWHVEVDAGDLKRFHLKHKRDKWDTLPKHVEVAVRKLLYHRRQAIDEAETGKGPKYRKAVKWRSFWRKRVEGMLRRARKDSTKRLLRQALEVK